MIKLLFYSIIHYMQKNSTVNLHIAGQDIHLCFLSEQPFRPTTADYEYSFFGGSPLWLHAPQLQVCQCIHCHNTLTFFGQLYCPLNAAHCYHRILYILFCQKCKHYFRCIRQQAPKSWQPPQQLHMAIVNIISQNAYQLQNEKMSKKQLNKIMNKAKSQLQEQKIIEEADSQDEEDSEDLMVKDVAIEQKQQTKTIQQKQYNEREIPGLESGNVDYVFEHYKRVINEIDNPCMLYTDIPLLYNNQTLNPKHICSKCGAKLQLQLQLTQQLLLLGQKQANQRILLMDWGAIFLYTCSSSCEQSKDEQIVIQFQIDAINEESIKKLKKKKKNKKRAQQKTKSKSKSKSRSKSKQKEANKQKIQKQDQQQGDWD